MRIVGGGGILYGLGGREMPLELEIITRLWVFKLLSRPCDGVDRKVEVITRDLVLLIFSFLIDVPLIYLEIDNALLAPLLTK